MRCLILNVTGNNEIIIDTSDLVESVILQDVFIHPKTAKVSRCYRLCFNPVFGMRDGAVLANVANSAMIALAKSSTNILDVEMR